MAMTRGPPCAFNSAAMAAAAHGASASIRAWPISRSIRFNAALSPTVPPSPRARRERLEKVSLHERRHGNPKHLAPGSMYGGELRFDKMLYDVVRVHVVGPLRWLVPEQRIYRGCTRSFFGPCLQFVEWEGISFGKGGETSGAGVRAAGETHSDQKTPWAASTSTSSLASPAPRA